MPITILTITMNPSLLLSEDLLIRDRQCSSTKAPFRCHPQRLMPRNVIRQSDANMYHSENHLLQPWTTSEVDSVACLHRKFWVPDLVFSSFELRMPTTQLIASATMLLPVACGIRDGQVAGWSEMASLCLQRIWSADRRQHSAATCQITLCFHDCHGKSVVFRSSRHGSCGAVRTAGRSPRETG